MLFQSWQFIFAFLPIVYIGYAGFYALGRTNFAKLWLVGGSLFFYGYWKIEYLPILVGSTLFNFSWGLLLQREGRKNALLTIGVLVNLGLLFFFKYYDFFIANLNAVAGSSLAAMQLILPLGISFFTFQNIAYLVDTKNGQANERNLLNYAVFLSFFPHQLAGPIMHHKEVMPQFKAPFKPTERAIYLGLFTFALGLVKKVGIADTFGVWADNAFHQAQVLSLLEAWAGSMSYTLQLYFDFSGYCDMAIGLGLLFNIRMPENFDSPLKSTSIIDFWQRWHMSLTQFIMGYIYMPMIRCFRELTLGVALLVTLVSMTIIGLWHGAAWTFVFFGFYHGMGLVVNNLWRHFKLPCPKALGWILTFLFVMIGFVYFRAESFADATAIVAAMFGGSTIVLPVGLVERLPILATSLGAQSGDWFAKLGTLGFKFNLLVAISWGLILLFKNSRQWREVQKLSWGTAYLTSLFIVLAINLIVSAANPAKFLYFNF